MHRYVEEYIGRLLRRQGVAVTAVFISIVVGASCLTLRANAAARRAIVLGIYATGETVKDPSGPNSLRPFLHNFERIVPLSYRERQEGKTMIDSAFGISADLAEAALNLSGVLTPHVKEQLAPIMNHQVDELYVHSWGTVAVFDAIHQGVMVPPTRLIVIDPPNLTPWGGAQWRRLVAEHPAMKIDIYINKEEIFQRIRENVQQIADFLLAGGIAADYRPYISGDVIAHFTGPGVTVRTFSIKSTPLFAAIQGHRLRQFLQFAVARRLYGLTSIDPTLDASVEALETLVADSDSDYLSKLSRDMMPFVEVQRRYWRNQARIRDPRASDSRLKELRKHAWDYFKSVVSLACSGPASLQAARALQSPYGVLIPYHVISEFYKADLPGLLDCDRGIIQKIVASEAPVSFDWVVQEAADYYERLRRERERLQREREEAERIRNQAAQRRERTNRKPWEEGNPRGDYHRSTGSVVSSADMPTRSSPEIHNDIKPPSGLASRQARGIAGGNTTIYDSR